METECFARYIHKSWGHEVILYNGEYCSKLLVYTKPGVASSLHYHPKKHETFYVSSGTFEVDDGGSPERLDAGSWLVLKPGVRHRIRCITPGTIVEASTHDDPNDCVRLVPSEA